MSAAIEQIVGDASRSTLFAIMEAPNVRRHWQAGRKLQFHASAWSTLDHSAITALLRSPTPRPHINLQDVARYLSGSISEDESQSGSN